MQCAIHLEVQRRERIERQPSSTRADKLKPRIAQLQRQAVVRISNSWTFPRTTSKISRLALQDDVDRCSSAVLRTRMKRGEAGDSGRPA